MKLQKKPTEEFALQTTATNLQAGLKKATTEMMVLFLLRQKPMYTYEMIQQMSKVSGGMLSFNSPASGWSYGGESKWTSGNAAYLTGKLSSGSKNASVSMVLNCDKNGNLS